MFVSRKWGGQKEMERLQRVMVAAAEQSKQFVLPEIKAPVDLSQFLKSKTTGTKIFCDPDGESIKPFICKRDGERITLLIGPEGDLTQFEKEALVKNKYLFCRLSQTVLRSELAATLVVGSFRIT